MKGRKPDDQDHQNHPSYLVSEPLPDPSTQGTEVGEVDLHDPHVSRREEGRKVNPLREPYRRVPLSGVRSGPGECLEKTSLTFTVRFPYRTHLCLLGVLRGNIGVATCALSGARTVF